MARPLRIEFPGAVYHVTSRGDRQETIFNDDLDRAILLDVLSEALSRLQGDVFAYCLMGNHYHLVLRTHLPNLSRIMKHVNGQYARVFNKRHDVAGHVFQGRFHAILVDRDAYLMEVCRYVELNPVRAGLVDSPVKWPWSSYRANVGVDEGPKWLARDELHSHLLQRQVATIVDRRQGAQIHAQLVAAGVGLDLWKGHLRQEIFLGSEDFVERMQSSAGSSRLESAEIPSSHRLAPAAIVKSAETRRAQAEAFRRAYYKDGLTMSAIARQACMSTSTVSRLIASAERFPEDRNDDRGIASESLHCKT